MGKIGGAASGELDKQFTVQVPLADVDNSIDQAVHKSEKALAKEEKRWVWMTESYQKAAEQARQRTEFSVKITLRMLYSEIMQTFNYVSQAVGWSKNQVFNIIANTITGVIGLISTANLAASTLAPIPIVGPFLAALSIGNAIAGTSLNIILAANQAQVSNWTSDIGDIMGGRL